MVKAEGSQISGCGFEPRRRIVDGVREACYYIIKRNEGRQKGYTPKVHLMIECIDENFNILIPYKK